MDTKTRKQEALSLLAKIERGGETRQLAEAMNRLNALTAQQAQTIVRNYVESVDACLALPLPSDCWFEISTPVGGIPESTFAINPHFRDGRLSGLSLADYRSNTRLPNVYLWYWWKLQPE